MSSLTDTRHVMPDLSFPDWDNMAIHQGMPYLLSALVSAFQPLLAVEAGTYRGHGAIAIAHALHSIQRGHLHTADPHDYGQATAISAAGVGGSVTVHLATYEQMLANVVGNERRVDFAFVDASGPRWDGAMRMRHLLTTYDRLSPGGVIVMDDIAATDWPFVNVIRDMAQLYIPGMRGVAIYQRRT